MDGGKRMTGNAGTVAIRVSSAQPAHRLTSWGHLGIRDWNVKRHYSQNASCYFQRDRLALLFSSKSSLMIQTFTIIVAEVQCGTDSLLKTTLMYGVMMCDSVARRGFGDQK